MVLSKTGAMLSNITAVEMHSLSLSFIDVTTPNMLLDGWIDAKRDDD